MSSPSQPPDATLPAGELAPESGSVPGARSSSPPNAFPDSAHAGRSGIQPKSGTRSRVVLFLVGVIINLLLGQWLVLQFDVPLTPAYAGVVLVGVLMGAVAGALAGALSVGLQVALLGDPLLLTGIMPAIWMGWVAGQVQERNLLRRPLHLLGAAIVAALGATLWTVALSSAPGGGIDFWLSLRASMVAGIQSLLMPEVALGVAGGPVLAFLLGVLLALPLQSRYIRASGDASTRSRAGAVGSAVLGWLVVSVVAWFFLPVLGRPLFAIFFIPVVRSVWRNASPLGVPAGLTATVLGAWGGIGLVAPPLGQGPLLVTDWVWLLFFVGISLYIVFVTDALQRRVHDLGNAVAAHRQTDARLQALAASLDDTLLLVSPDRRVSLVNEGFQEIFAAHADNVQGKLLDAAGDIFQRALADPARFERFIAETLADPASDASVTIEQAWPVARELVVYSVPVRRRDEYFGRLYLLHDQTHKRELDQLYRRVATLVAEDLRAPAARIRGLATKLSEGAADMLGDLQMRQVMTIRANAERLIALIEQMSEAARLESDRFHLEVSPVDLRQLIQATATTLRPLLHEKQQTLTIDVPDDLPPVEGDPARLAQALANLISNAHKFTPRGGWVRVEARIVTRAKLRQVRVAVIDGGHGIARQDQKGLFQRFYRVETDQTRDQLGTGLGLATVAAIVRLHGGEVDVDSAPGHGSTFAFVLPLTHVVAPVAPTEPVPGLPAEVELSTEEPAGVIATAGVVPAEVVPAEVAPAEVVPAEVAPVEVAPAEVASAEPADEIVPDASDGETTEVDVVPVLEEAAVADRLPALTALPDDGGVSVESPVVVAGQSAEAAMADASSESPAGGEAAVVSSGITAESRPAAPEEGHVAGVQEGSGEDEHARLAAVIAAVITTPPALDASAQSLPGEVVDSVAEAAPPAEPSAADASGSWEAAQAAADGAVASGLHADDPLTGRDASNPVQDEGVSSESLGLIGAVSVEAAAAAVEPTEQLPMPAQALEPSVEPSVREPLDHDEAAVQALLDGLSAMPVQSLPDISGQPGGEPVADDLPVEAGSGDSQVLAESLPTSAAVDADEEVAAQADSGAVDSAPTPLRTEPSDPPAPFDPLEHLEG